LDLATSSRELAGSLIAAGSLAADIFAWECISLEQPISARSTIAPTQILVIATPRLHRVQKNMRIQKIRCSEMRKNSSGIENPLSVDLFAYTIN
jgi:hypothetical protein